jgi:hypothetical protein
VKGLRNKTESASLNNRFCISDSHSDGYKEFYLVGYNAVYQFRTMFSFVRSEVFSAVTTKTTVFWDVAPCRYCINRRFGGTYCLYLQGRRKKEKIRDRGTSVSRCLQTAATCSRWFLDRGFSFSTLKMEAICSFETSVYTISTWRHIPEDGILEYFPCCLLHA